MLRKKREGWLQVAPFCTTRLAAYTHLLSKVQDQIPMRKVSTLIQSLVSRHPNHHLGYSQDREKHHTLPTLLRRYNIVYDVTNVEQHEVLGTDTSHPLLDVTPGRPYPLAVVEGVQSCNGGNQACLPGTLCKSSRGGPTHSERAARWARTRSCSRSSAWRPGFLPQPVLPTSFAPAGDQVRTTPQGCERVRHSSGKGLAEGHPSSKHPTANLRSCQSWPWHLPLSRTSRPPSSLPICPDGWTRK